MRLVHRHDGHERVLASDVDVADSFLTKARGLMFRRSIPDDYALAFRFDGPGTRSLHMAFVPFAIDAVWTVEGEVTKVKRLPAWRGLGWATADEIYELPAGAADGVEPGHEVALVD
ncbi:DUF192 domain-containing protein [Halobium salinum]|uniref:DUF192 domain-containing protein n=1 Tax=Halobium salinum TaxID=1364940 RepID=A0ABD5PD75_9EURY|nr:DUF192 domain-containing protein [Halobium salinum]